MNTIKIHRTIIRLILLSQLSLWLFACAGSLTQETTAAEDKNLFDSIGIEVIAIRQTAAGAMLDFRYKVLDPTKSMSMFREDIRPYLIKEETGEIIRVTDTTKVGPMRPTSRNPRAGKTYFMFFINPHKSIKSGDKVTIVIGDQRIENLIVE